MTVRPQLVTVKTTAGGGKHADSPIPEYWRMIDETIRLTADNKVNIKNAFDIDINCIDTLTQLIDSNKLAGGMSANTENQENNKWGRTGEALGAGAKIYGYRVDNVHMETYKILGGLHRHGLQGEHELELIMHDGERKEDEK
jgi:condensin complex subunit 2